MKEVLGSWIEGAFADEAVLERVSERLRDVAFEEEIVQDMGMEDDEVEVGGGQQSIENGMEAAEVVTITADDFLRMEFNNPKEAARIYEEYSRVKGFAVRQGKKIKNKRGEFVQITYLCNREGFRDKKWLEKQDRKREHKVVTRCGCPAEMRIKPRIDTGKWFVARFVDEHNHDLLPQKFVEYLPAHRKISDVDIAHMDSLRQVGISIPKIYKSIAAQAGGFNRVSFTKRDMYNEVRRQRSLQNGDVNAALRFLEGLVNTCDLFWSDGRSQEDFRLFGDVLAFDATYGRNEYNLSVVVFSGVNNHNQTCVFATAMVSSETQSSYVWVLRKFLECMDGRAPKAIITDGDRSMRVAIQEVFPDAHHRLCAWHLLKNATSNVCMPRFTSLFRHCMLADIEVEEFELQWEAMVSECGVKDHEWVKDLYSKKLLWATTYIRGRFFAGIRTTSRCESLHAKLGRFVESRYGILEFITNFQRCVEFLRDNEDELEFRSSYGTPVIQTEFPELEKSGAMNFTREIFARYRESLKRCVRVTVLGCIESEGTCTYVTQKYRRPEKRWNVTHHGMSDTFVCTCLRMESFGIPCVQILAMLVRLDIGSLPKSLVLQRWSKAAKVEMSGVNQVNDMEALYRNRVGAFLQHCKRFARVACQSEENFKVYTEKVVEDTLRLEMMNGDAGDGAGSGHAAQGVRDPIGVRTKGTGRANEPFGSRAVKRRKCSTCRCLGHRRTHCPNGPRVTTSYTEQNTVPSQHMPNRDPTVSYAGNGSNNRRRRVG
ncbi:hypothetical protein Ahy_A04g017637 isoform A [Arachis hypogaea]|uniref:Uncharacterized protein n=1 Tax=Arachis hypogaea TaxID=3818 RepID=A0A445DBQ9_ARAHY|nr:hypothetical protein Ahy_A04g017637 isoform A [Arachis hypogaea]